MGDTSQYDRQDPTPTYADAISRDKWRIICPRLPRETLRRLLWVSKFVSAQALAALWVHPAKSFQNRRAGPLGNFELMESSSIVIYERADAFRRFQRAVGSNLDILTPAPTTERTRQLTRVLDLRALAGIATQKDVPDSRRWLYSLLLRLRNVRCVLFEDFAPLNADCLLYLAIRHDWDLDGSPRMLVARAMHIPRSTYLGHFVLGFGTVSYLDLSKTTCAGEPAFLNQVALSGFFRSVGILKLRGVKLEDDGLLAIITSANRSIWSLDVRNNKLTSQSLANLRRFSVQPPRYDPGDEYSSYVEGEDQLGRAIKFLSNGQTKGILRGTGLTHLYIADNDPGFLATAVADLLASERLVAVDIGVCWPSRQTSSGRLVPFPEPSAGSAQLRDRVAPPQADNQVTPPQAAHQVAPQGEHQVAPPQGEHQIAPPQGEHQVAPPQGERQVAPPRASHPDTYHIGKSIRYERVHHTLITGQCLGNDDDLDITQLASGEAGKERVKELLVKAWFMRKVAQGGLTELVLMELPAVSRLGFLSRGLQIFLNELAKLEDKTKQPTTLRKLVLEFRPSAVPKVFGDNPKPPDIPLRHDIIPPTDSINRDGSRTPGVETSGETPAHVPWDGIIVRTLRRYWRADGQRWSGDVVFRAADASFFW